MTEPSRLVKLLFLEVTVSFFFIKIFENFFEILGIE